MSEPTRKDTQFAVERVRQLIEELTERLNLLNQTAERVRQQPSWQMLDELLRMLPPITLLLEKLSGRVLAHEKEREQLRALQDTGAAINSSLDLEEVLRLVMDDVIELTGAERGFLMLTDEETGALEVRVARNMDRETIAQSSFDISRSIVDSVARTGEPVVTLNAQTDPRFHHQASIISYNLRSILCVPLKIREKTTGVVYADNRIASGIFGDDDRDMLVAFANQAAVAIANARLFQKTREQLQDITAMKNLMDDVFASIASGVITIDDAGQIALFNEAAEQILALDARDVLERPYQEVLKALDGFIAAVEQVRASGGQHFIEFDMPLAPRPGRTSLSLTLSPLRGPQDHSRGVTVVVDDVSEKKRLQSVRRYLPPALVDRAQDLDAVQRPQRREMSVLFADVRGFTSISEQLPPEELIEILNGYLSVAAAAINHYEGVIDKYMGDAIMAEFNTTLNPQEDHVERAVRTALMMRRELAVYHDSFPPERRLYFGIGVNSGEAVVGNVGSHFRKDYSAIGDAVNLAKRLQELAGPGQIMIGAAVYNNVKSWVQARPLGSTRIKGRQALEQVYELIGERT